MKTLWWKCPNCGEKVDFVEEMSFLFEEDGKAEFDPKSGLMFHTIFCKCNTTWTTSISKPERLDVK